MPYSYDNISLIRSNISTADFDSGNITDITANSYANLFYPYLLDNGGNQQNVSLTIDILNKEELQQETKNLVNKDWVNKNRLEGNVSEPKAIWGFKETSHSVKKTKALSNAICFGGQQLTFYIATQGHETGYVDNQWIYSKTTIVISAIDIVNGTNTILHTFDGFQKDNSDSTRYFNWDVPLCDSSFFSNYGMFGLVVLNIQISKSYYEDAQWQVPIVKSIPYQNQSSLQLLVYSGSKEIIEVNAGNLNILTSTPSYSDTLEQIFSNTIFESLQSLNQNLLTNSQKRAIIADQIAVLFMSQHPVITADFYPGKIIGVGASAAVVPKKIIDKAIIYSKKYPNIVPVINDRLFGMMATYKAFNYTVDIQKYIPNYHQSSQVIKDPVRIICTDEDGYVSSDLGIDGVIFDPYVISVINAETIFDSPDALPIDMILQDGIVDIQNIQILNGSGTQLQPHSSTAKISFDVIYGDSEIKTIKYSIFSQDSLNYQEYTDYTGLSRFNIFNLDNEILPKPAKRGDVVSAQIDIEDVYGSMYSFVYTLGLHGYTDAPTLRDLKIYQRKDGSKMVDIFYTYDGLGEINNSYLYVQFSGDNGVTWDDIPTTSLSGDFGSNIMPGRRMVSWKPLIDLENITSDYPVLCRLTLYDVDDNIATGNTLTGALVKNLGNPEIAVMRI